MFDQSSSIRRAMLPTGISSPQYVPMARSWSGNTMTSVALRRYASPRTTAPVHCYSAGQFGGLLRCDCSRRFQNSHCRRL